MDLFTHANQQRMKNEAPLAVRMARVPWTSTLVRRTSSAPANCCAAPSKPAGFFPPSCSGARRMYNLRTVLFVDEVHRWNKPPD